jgi:hypothetical protein
MLKYNRSINIYLLLQIEMSPNRFTATVVATSASIDATKVGAHLP